MLIRCLGLNRITSRGFRSKLINNNLQFRNFHSIHQITSSSQLVNHLYNQNHVSAERKSIRSSNGQQQLLNQIHLKTLTNSLFMMQNRLNSTEAARSPMDQAIKSSVEQIKKQDSAEIDLTDFQIPSLPTPEEIEMIKTTITAFDLGLTSWLPTGLLFSLFDFLNKQGIEWPVTIIVSTLLIRTIITPVIISSRKQAIEVNNLMSEYAKFREESEKVQLSGNLMELNKIAMKYSDVGRMDTMDKIKNISKWSMIKMPLLQGFLFMSFFITLRKMCFYPIPSLKESTFLWLPSLADKDPYYILPLLTSLSLFFTLRIGIDTGTMGVGTNSKIQKIAVYAMPLGSLILTFSFPSALCLYWCTANVHSLTLAYLLKFDKVRKLLNVPENTDDKSTKSGASGISNLSNPVDSIKTKYRDFKSKSNIKNMDKSDYSNFEKAGQGPLKKTYRYDPTKRRQNI